MATAKPKKKEWTVEERVELMQKLQDDLEDFVAQKSIEARNKKAEDTKSTDEVIEEMKNHPAFMTEVDFTKPLTPELEALMQLKYESEDPTARADSYREDGNDQFKKKKYKIAIDNYTEGIKSKCPDKALNAVLYTNRAAAQYHLGNYRSSFNDCIFARKFKPDHFKAILRGAQCCSQMNKHSDTIRWCDVGLLLDGDNKVLLDLRAKAEKDKRIKERDERKRAAQERKDEIEENKIMDSIQQRGICLANMKEDDDSKLNKSLLTNMESHNPTGAKVHIDSEGALQWPVVFFYPEYGETDFISAFNENHSFLDHLDAMFGPDTEPAPWDREKKYKPENIEIVFECVEEEKLYPMATQSTLLEALQHKKYKVFAGTPGFIILAKKSSFRTEFYSRYKQ